MDQLSALGRDVLPSLAGSFKVYGDLQTKNKEAILSIPRVTHRYGSHPRHVLDIYQPKTVADDTPILIYLYGGGLERGDRIMPHPPATAEGLTYANVGYYFASHGFITVIPDYRRTPEGATFPSGGEDLAIAIDWLQGHFKPQRRELYIMGHSAGSIHVVTFLLAPPFADTVSPLTNPSTNQAAIFHLTGVILVSTPCSFVDRHDPARTGVLKQYYGSRLREDSPLGLLQSASPTRKPQTRILMVNGTLDPQVELLDTVDEFAETWATVFDCDKAERQQQQLQVVNLEGHNHFSAVLGLGTGVEREEILGKTVLDWIQAS